MYHKKQSLLWEFYLIRVKKLKKCENRFFTLANDENVILGYNHKINYTFVQKITKLFMNVVIILKL